MVKLMNKIFSSVGVVKQSIASEVIVQREAMNTMKLSVLADMLGNDEQIMREVLQKFLGNSAYLVEQMRQAVSAEDRNQVRFLAHRMKSGARMIGALDLGDICENLELAESVPTFTQLTPYLSDYFSEAEQVREWIELLLASPERFSAALQRCSA